MKPPTFLHSPSSNKNTHAPRNQEPLQREWASNFDSQCAWGHAGNNNWNNGLPLWIFSIQPIRALLLLMSSYIPTFDKFKPFEGYQCNPVSNNLLAAVHLLNGVVAFVTTDEAGHGRLTACSAAQANAPLLSKDRFQGGGWGFWIAFI